MQVSNFFKPARAPVLCLLCLIFFGCIRPVRALQRAEGAEVKLTYANLHGVWREHSDVIRWLDGTGKVETHTPRHKNKMTFTDKPAPGGGFWLYLGGLPGNAYSIVDATHIRVGAGLYKVNLTRSTLTLTKRNAQGTVDFIHIYERDDT